ncbi:fucose permease [Pseudoduganella flava]|uniref:Fucose permease n=1 Tax=Pseudoduganella flava TaxID=871742 RepID=A0A562Q441_9BURK|nr:MFS transporter [Pseudoduganella flava]QGZ41529.1 MFS transporter [Pseudoduganella flava]TWI51502.1 fucose permease [Pseudoduganella flava]
MTGLAKARLAAMSVLFCNGVIYASWGTHVPTIKDKFDLSDAKLSLSMLAVALGGILIMAWAGRWIARVGSARASVVSGVLMALAAFGILLVPQYALLLSWLALYGATSAVNDVAANSQAAVIEATFDRPVIGSLHGSFSLGGMFGALVASGWQAMQWPNHWHLAAVCTLCATLSLSTARWLLPEPAAHRNEDGTPRGQQPLMPAVRRKLVVLGVLAFAALIVEGAMYDWTAVYMRDVALATGGFVSAGYAAFSIGMATGRFTGDPVRARFSEGALVLGSCALCLAGLGLALALPAVPTALAGFLVCGLGVANIIPVMFSSAGRIALANGVSPSTGLAVTTRLAYVGLLVGPVIVGFIANHFDLRTALALSLVGVLAIAASARGVFAFGHKA